MCFCPDYSCITRYPDNELGGRSGTDCCRERTLGTGRSLPKKRSPDLDTSEFDLHRCCRISAYPDVIASLRAPTTLKSVAVHRVALSATPSALGMLDDVRVQERMRQR